MLSLPSCIRVQIAQRTFASPYRVVTLRPPPSIITSTSSTSSFRTYATLEDAVSPPPPAPTIPVKDAPSPPPSSVNSSEVSHFNALASSWWDPQGSSRLLHLMNPLRHNFIRQCLSTVPPDPAHKKLTYLDVGCGGGIFAESAARLANTSSVTAIDPSPEVVAIAKTHQRHDPTLLEPNRLTYLNTSIEQLSSHRPAEAGQYDIITVFEVLEHIRHPTSFLTNCLTHLKPGGWLIGSTIARTPMSWFTTKFVAEEVLRMVPRGTHTWEQYIQPQELRDWARGRRELSKSDGLGWRVMGVVYVPGLGWKEVKGSEGWGNYFFGVRRIEAGGE